MLILLGIDFGDQLKGELELIAKTPITFIVAFIVAVVSMWTIFHFLFKHRFETAVHAEAMTKDALHSMKTLKETFREQLEEAQKKIAVLIDEKSAASPTIIAATGTAKGTATVEGVGESKTSPGVVRAKDWLDLRYRFEQLKGLGIGARWIADDEHEIWNIDGGKTTANNLDVEVLCRYAGMMLTKSPRIWQAISGGTIQTIKTEPDHLRRWLFYLKAREGTEGHMLGESRVGDRIIKSEHARIGDLVGASVRAATDCATTESD